MQIVKMISGYSKIAQIMKQDMVIWQKKKYGTSEFMYGFDLLPKVLQKDHVKKKLWDFQIETNQNLRQNYNSRFWVAFR